MSGFIFSPLSASSFGPRLLDSQLPRLEAREADLVPIGPGAHQPLGGVEGQTYQTSHRGPATRSGQVRPPPRRSCGQNSKSLSVAAASNALMCLWELRRAMTAARAVCRGAAGWSVMVLG